MRLGNRGLRPGTVPRDGGVWTFGSAGIEGPRVEWSFKVTDLLGTRTGSRPDRLKGRRAPRPGRGLEPPLSLGGQIRRDRRDDRVPLSAGDRDRTEPDASGVVGVGKEERRQEGSAGPLSPVYLPPE